MADPDGRQQGGQANAGHGQQQPDADLDAPILVKEALCRIAQEALHNAAKHARCDRLDVRLTCVWDILGLEVVDDGAGFDPLGAYPGHLGLRSMRERAERVCGTLDIHTSAGQGTQVRVSVPRSGLTEA